MADQRGGGRGPTEAMRATTSSPRRTARWLSALAVVLFSASIQAEKAKSTDPNLRWTARTPDEMLDLALRRAAAGGDGALAGVAIAYSLVDRASAGRARAGLDALGRGSDDIAAQAHWVSAG